MFIGKFPLWDNTKLIANRRRERELEQGLDRHDVDSCRTDEAVCFEGGSSSQRGRQDDG
jgi:hypothetical protein